MFVRGTQISIGCLPHAPRLGLSYVPVTRNPTHDPSVQGRTFYQNPEGEAISEQLFLKKGLLGIDLSISSIHWPSAVP